MKSVDHHFDNLLRARVKLLGDVLGKVIHEQNGKRVFDAVEKLRCGFSDLKKNDDAALHQELVRFIAEMDDDTTRDVVRAFSTYFNLVNVAEEITQHKRYDLTEQNKASETQSEVKSFEDILRFFKEQEVSPQQVQILLKKLCYMPVFTAHPTEARRRTTMDILSRVLELLVQLEASDLEEEQEGLQESLECAVQVLWKTDEMRLNKPTVEAEVANGLYYFNASLFQAIPETYRNLENAIHKVYGGEDIQLPSFIRFGSWIGGDRDGNPYVTPEVTYKTVRIQKIEVLKEYSRRLGMLADTLTYSASFVEPSEAFTQDQKKIISSGLAQAAFSDRHTDFSREPYRRKIAAMRYCLQITLDLTQGRSRSRIEKYAYTHPQQLLDDLLLVDASMRSHGDARLACRELQDLIRMVQTFGFHLMPLDIREESSRHTGAVSEIAQQWGTTHYAEMDSQQRAQYLTEKLAQKAPLTCDVGQLSKESKKILAVFDCIKNIRKTNGEEAISNYVISMTHHMSDVLEVMLLGKIAGLIGRDQDGALFCNISPAPLFETIDDLNRVREILNELLSNPVYSALLSASGNMQEVMLGYSDSCKDGGILSSVWGLYLAQKNIMSLIVKYNVSCRLFHGRGGTIGRGGGPTYRAIVSQPPGTVNGQIKITEQGEVLSFKYSHKNTAVYEISTAIAGLLWSSRHQIMNDRFDLKEKPKDNSEYLKTMDYLAEQGEQTYRDLIDDTDGILDYFYEATPIQEVGSMNIGSRPSHRRKSDRSRKSIRAIPWVFSWSLSRHTLPAWYGLGSALQKYVEDKDTAGMQHLRDMYQQWSFFHNLMENIHLPLSKANMETARQYAGLCEDQEKAQKIFAMIEEEYEKTVRYVLEVSGCQRLLEHEESQRLSLERRDPYLDPLHYIQVALLKKAHKGNPKDSKKGWLMVILRTISAISSGMRNTG